MLHTSTSSWIITPFLTSPSTKQELGPLQVRDLVSTGASILLMGPPGVGKTTAIREVSRMLADEYNKRVVIVDTSNEIGGDGDIPHPGIGRARRMQVPSPEFQHHVSPLLSCLQFAALQKPDGFTCSTVEIVKGHGVCSLGATQT
jgi:Cdc6-like AAA superfamily ATPase